MVSGDSATKLRGVRIGDPVLQAMLDDEGRAHLDREPHRPEVACKSITTHQLQSLIVHFYGFIYNHLHIYTETDKSSNLHSQNKPPSLAEALLEPVWIDEAQLQ